MSDFPEHVFIGRDDDICVLEIEEDADFIDVYDSSQQYIRADLVPQWQPIETLGTNDRVILLRDSGEEETGFLTAFMGRKAVRSWFGYSPLDSFTHWMPIPKVQE